MFSILMALLIPAVFSSALSHRPNIIMILADDLDTQNGNWIDSFPKIKNLLAENGTTFTNAFVSVALCCPSRASLLTGRYAHNTKILTNEYPTGCFQTMQDSGLEQSTIATWLQAANYQTVLLGKYLNGYPKKMNRTYIPPGWNEWYAGENDRYTQFDYTLNQNGKLVSYGSKPEDYEQDVLKGLAVDFINRASLNPEPFFMWMASFSPHRPATFAPRHAQAFLKAVAPRTPNFNDPSIPQSLWTHALPLLNRKQIAALDNLYRKRMKSMLAVEDTVEAIVKALKSTGQLDNTFLFFSSDNGFHLGQRRMKAGKNTGYEEDLRVPLIVRGPGVAKGVKSTALVLNNDLAPTIAELALVEWPESIDGRSFGPILLASQAAVVVWRQAFLLEHGEDHLKRLPSPFKGIHTANKVFIDYQNQKQPEFYNLEDDPYEQGNSAPEADPQELNQLAAWLEVLQACAGPTCRAVENAHP